MKNANLLIIKGATWLAAAGLLALILDLSQYYRK
jgi:hypothetical protein